MDSETTITFEVQFQTHTGHWVELTVDHPESLEEARKFAKVQRKKHHKDLKIRIAKVITTIEEVEKIA